MTGTVYVPARTNVAGFTSTGPVSIASLPLAQAVSEAIMSIRSVLDWSKGGQDHDYRDIKMVLSSSSALTAAVKHATSLYEIMLSAERVEAFHRAVLEEVKKESEECALRIYDRLQRLEKQMDPGG
jgi:hypothetical protein